MTFLRYVAIQLIAYCIDMGLFLFALHFELLGPIGSNVAAKLAAGGFAFLAHRSFTFDVAGRDGIRQQAFRYFLVLALNIPVASAILAMILHWTSAPVISKFISDVICVAISYGLSKYFIFNAGAKLSKNSLPSVEK